MSYETRKLPKKTIVIISIIIALGVFIFIWLEVLKNQKFNEVLSDLGHKDIKNLKVVNRINVEDTITKEKSYVYKLTFFDNTLNKTCIGFVSKQKDKTYTKDFDCK
ncbi:hypothetical protein [Aliarcobacter cryaerophilus]|jgi:hypothetical protein|uniref:hypothetical protein n=1 Tax=Aliarcobacter cryaerophilus TaxID=28198 RepID=UPI00082E4FFF|nr:hypothetical protein [Aliarcobacter cryaerophilus]MCT7504784.1 hypothetical protein [Aliarcobacter cryaerophilus]